jgi:hypothetical protein
MKRIPLRILLPWLVVAAVVAFAVYRVKIRPMPATQQLSHVSPVK